MDANRPAYLHPSLEWVCSLPANPADITIEHARAICAGDVQGVLRDIVQLTYDDMRQPAIQEAERVSA